MTVVRDHDAEMDELDREYYRSKLEELSWCLPVVRAAAKVCNPGNTSLADREELREAVRAYQAQEEVKR